MDEYRKPRRIRVVGIDPGTTRIGYALLERSGHAIALKTAETIRIPSRFSRAERLLLISQALEKRFRRDRPDAVAVETLFFTTNKKTALSVAEARGVILLTAQRHVHSIGEYTPSAVKAAVAGDGRADKAGVRRMARFLLPGADIPVADDAVDAVAIALCALAERRAFEK